MNQCFIKIRKTEEADIILPRVVELECVGLPVTAWLQENLMAFTKNIGKWISWSFKREDHLEVYNPRITCVTRSVKKIHKHLIVLIKGKKHEIVFKERDDPWFDNCVTQEIENQLKRDAEKDLEDMGEIS